MSKVKQIGLYGIAVLCKALSENEFKEIAKKCLSLIKESALDSNVYVKDYALHAYCRLIFYKHMFIENMSESLKEWT